MLRYVLAATLLAACLAHPRRGHKGGYNQQNSDTLPFGDGGLQEGLKPFGFGNENPFPLNKRNPEAAEDMKRYAGKMHPFGHMGGAHANDHQAFDNAAAEGFGHPSSEGLSSDNAHSGYFDNNKMADRLKSFFDN